MAFITFWTRVLAALYFCCTVLADDPSFDAYADTSVDPKNFTLAINVPSNESDGLYFHFHAPASRAWAAFGFGSGMTNSLMFVVYAAEAGGDNITLAPRLASGHKVPQLTTDVKVELLNGSGITSEGLFWVNAHCTGCRQWSTGSIDINNEKQNMVYALGPEASFQSQDASAKITQHAAGAHQAFTLDLKRATGDAGVPVLRSTAESHNEPNGDNDGDDDSVSQEFPIVIHLLLLLACFLFVLPGGYLFLRVFNKVWLHAGIQSLGLVLLIAGVIAGIVYNVQNKIAISYHQVLGIITSLLVFAAFTLGLISHQYFKKRKVSSPLMKFHRMAGPSAIVFGWGTAISGFAFRGEPRRILFFMVVLLAVIIFVGSITFLMQKRKVRNAALVTPAAQNFNAAYYNPQQGGNAPPAYNGQAQEYYGRNDSVPMQTFHHPTQPGYGYGQKGPDVHVQSNQI